MTLLLDASVVMAAILKDEPLHGAARSSMLALRRAGGYLASDLIDQELANALSKATRRRRMDSSVAADAMTWWLREPTEYVRTRPVVQEALQRSIKGEGHVYDLLQVLAAREVGARLLSADLRLAESLATSDLAGTVLRLDDADRVGEAFGHGGGG